MPETSPITNHALRSLRRTFPSSSESIMGKTPHVFLELIRTEYNNILRNSSLGLSRHKIWRASSEQNHITWCTVANGAVRLLKLYNFVYKIPDIKSILFDLPKIWFPEFKDFNSSISKYIDCPVLDEKQGSILTHLEKGILEFGIPSKFGVEIECYLPNNCTYTRLNLELDRFGILTKIRNLEDSQDFTTWNICSDGSLTTGSENGRYGIGVELVSPIIEDFNGVIDLFRVIQYLNRIGCVTDNTCGLHVHVGLRDFNVSTKMFINLFRLFLKYETLFDTFVQQNRRKENNRYATSTIPFISRLDLVDHATPPNKIEDDSINHLLDKYGRSWDNRYRKLNLDSYKKYGTVEFRHHHGTLDWEEIIYWVRLCMRIVNAAYHNPKIEINPADTSNTYMPGNLGTLPHDLRFTQPEIEHFKNQQTKYGDN